jgi:hypothetical protein
MYTNVPCAPELEKPAYMVLILLEDTETKERTEAIRMSPDEFLDLCGAHLVSKALRGAINKFIKKGK